MILRGIAKRYAVALFDAARNQDIAEQVHGDVRSFVGLLDARPEFRNFLLSPQVLTDDKKALLHSVLDERASGLFVRFVLLLLDKKRLDEVDTIADAFHYLYEESQGIAEARVITAVQLDRETETKTVARLEQETGKQIRLEAEVDPALIGGMIVILDGKIIDGSVRTHLDELRRDLLEAKVY